MNEYFYVNQVFDKIDIIFWCNSKINYFRYLKLKENVYICYFLYNMIKYIIHIIKLINCSIFTGIFIKKKKNDFRKHVYLFWLVTKYIFD